MRLKDLLGVSLEELKTLLAAEEARAEVRAQLRRDDVIPERRRELLSEALGHVDRQLELVRRRASELATPPGRALGDPQAHPPPDARDRRRAAGTFPPEDARPGSSSPAVSAAVEPSPPSPERSLTPPGPWQDITYEASGRATRERLSGPPRRKARPPAMVVIHEAGGLGEHIRDVVNRFANLGYVTLGVDLYTREGGPPPMDDMAVVMERLFAIPDERVLGDLEAAADLLRSREDVSGRVGCIGFCMGGRYTLLFATSSDRLDAAVDCWGGFIHRSTPEEISTPRPARRRRWNAPRLCCPLLAAVGAEDQNPSPALGEELRSAAGEAGSPCTWTSTRAPGHAFFADYRPTYRPEPAALLWERDRAVPRNAPPS